MNSLSQLSVKCLSVEVMQSHRDAGMQGWRSGEINRLLPMWPGLIPRSSVICGLRLLVLYSALRGFLRVLGFPLPSKTNI